MTRDEFRAMPPLRHNRDLNKSGVCLHIAKQLGCDLEQAKRTFKYLRDHKHLRFQEAGRWWMGVEYVPEETDAAYRARVASELAFLQAKVKRLEGFCERIKEANNRICDHVGL